MKLWSKAILCSQITQFLVEIKCDCDVVIIFLADSCFIFQISRLALIVKNIQLFARFCSFNFAIFHQVIVVTLENCFIVEF